VYTLSAVDGLGVESTLGQVAIPGAPAGLRVWPQPAGEDGRTQIEFAAPRAPDGSVATDVEVAVFDVRGRLVTRLVDGRPTPVAGVVHADWSGLTHSGIRAGAGVYFVRLRSRQAGVSTTARLVLLDNPAP